MSTYKPKMGRPKLPKAELKSHIARVKLNDAQWRKLLKLGGPMWLRDAIDKAKE